MEIAGGPNCLSVSRIFPRQELRGRFTSKGRHRVVPVALASATAAVLRRYILGFGPLFPVPEHPLFIGPEGLLGCVVVGLLAGGLSALPTLSVCAAEDAFQCNIPRMREASMKMARIILCSPG